MSAQSTTTTTTNKIELSNREQWVENLTFSCVKCSATYKTRNELMGHYDHTRHDRYSTWKD